MLVPLAASIWLPMISVWHVLVSIALGGLILMHSGRDAGFGGMGFTPASQGGTHIVERNLTRLTVVVGVMFFINKVVVFRCLYYDGFSYMIVSCYGCVR